LSIQTEERKVGVGLERRLTAVHMLHEECIVLYETLSVLAYTVQHIENNDKSIKIFYHCPILILNLVCSLPLPARGFQ